AVPIFWMDTDDHDLAEITRLTYMDVKQILQVTDCREKLYGAAPESVRPVGALELPEAIDAVRAEYVSRLAPSVRDADIGEILGFAYRAASRYSDAFARMMVRLFRGRGLLLFDPRDPEAKALLAPLFLHVAKRGDTLVSALLERGLALKQSRFQPQVEVQENSALLFMEIDGVRRALLRAKGHFVLKNEAVEFTQERLAGLLRKSPERFSPNVLLRPIAQDHLFPSVIYVGGPAEVAYFAQAAVLYRDSGRPMPVIWPRFSATVLDNDVRAIMKKHGITFEDCLSDRKTLSEKLARAGPGKAALARVSELRSEIERVLDELLPRLVEVDPTLGPALATARRKMRRNLDRIEGRLVQAGADSEIEYLLDYLRPNQNLQEREFSIHQLIARHGLQVLETLYSAIRIERPAHFIVEIESGKE
ncbi:MAG: bacillithiol biosynthesis cysteine-adding enzyme BshC, partial [Acidobacteria bacterium]|nr:bacillithiol biosynthesis cysteine-adding enzyme BshC [Acidobacteriota bacterium]